MATRAYQARIECDADTLQHLWRTHCIFNQRLPLILRVLFRMRRGECGQTSSERKLYQTIAHFVLDNSQHAEYLLNSVSTVGWTPNTAKNRYKAKVPDDNGAVVEVSGDVWADAAAVRSADGELLYNKSESLGDVPAHLRQIICRECAAIINGHSELLQLWNEEHEQWLRRKAAWESQDEHRMYLSLRPRFEAFEQTAGGKAAKRRGRWHLYLDWLRANPDLAAWRGGPAEVHAISHEGQERIRKAKPWKQRSTEAEEFWKANPALFALDKLHGYYEREFVRRRKRKRNRDGFDHPPTFTEPHATRHPRWFVFNAPQTNPAGYRNLRFPDVDRDFGSLDLLLLTGDRSGRKFPSDWVSVNLRADPRLRLFRTVKRPSKRKSSAREKDGYEFFDRHLKQWRPADVSGAKLILKDIRLNSDGSLKSATPYVYFTVTMKDIPFTEMAKRIEWSETGEVTRRGRKRKTKHLPDGLVACAVDLGLRHLGFATLCAYERGAYRILRSRNLWLGREEWMGEASSRWSAGPDLAHIAQHKREVRRLRRLRGKPIRGEESHVELQDHITHMAEDRFKKSARLIMNFALNCDQARNQSSSVYPRADVLLLESLEGFIPDAERERGINRALAAWNRGQLVKAVRDMAKDAGLKVFEINPIGTSQVCSRCGALGRRFSIVKDPETGTVDLRFGWVEKLFACPECRYRANADHNASVNLHRRFLLEDRAVESYLAWRGTSDLARRAAIEALDRALAEQIRPVYRLEPASDADPF